MANQKLEQKPVELPRRITDRWIRERTPSELAWLVADFQGTANGKRFVVETRRRESLRVPPAHDGH